MVNSLSLVQEKYLTIYIYNIATLVTWFCLCVVLSYEHLGCLELKSCVLAAYNLELFSYLNFHDWMTTARTNLICLSVMTFAANVTIMISIIKFFGLDCGTYDSFVLRAI